MSTYKNSPGYSSFRAVVFIFLLYFDALVVLFLPNARYKVAGNEGKLPEILLSTTTADAVTKAQKCLRVWCVMENRNEK